ncbi:MAG: hypothetical protein IJ717_03330 [Treponema sp.]|nr:hypothetical protein [Treponema sp.]
MPKLSFLGKAYWKPSAEAANPVFDSVSVKKASADSNTAPMQLLKEEQ